jgi:hypothetical protein
MKEVNRKTLDELRTALYKAGHETPNLYERDFAEMLDSMISLARAHHKLAEAACNGDLTPHQVKREQTIEKTIAAIAQVFNLTVHFDGDPRGFTVKLHAPNGTMYNTWGGAETGYGI